jgi:hypothetical protein
MSELGFDLGADANAGDSVVHLPGLYTGPPPVGAALENFEINKFHRNTFLMS